MANTFKFGNKNWAVKEDYVLAYNDENSNFKPLPFDFTRSSTATYVDSDGLIKTAKAGHARIDYLDNADGHLLLEPSRTNFIPYSEDFNSVWVERSVTLTANSVISPDGTQNASTLTINNSTPYLGDLHNIVTTGSTYTISCFVKKGTNRWVRLASYSSATSGAWFDLENGIVGTVNSTSASIEDFGNGWYRIKNTTIVSNGNNQAFIGLSDADGGTSSSQIGNTVHIYGAQIEAGSYATSYIPTEGSSVTRAADSCEGAGNSEVFNDSEGVLFVEMAGLSNDSTYKTLTLNDNSVSDRVQISFNADSIYEAIVDGSVSKSFENSSVSDIKLFNKVAVKYKLNDISLYINGFETNTDTTATMPTGLSQIDFHKGDGSDNFYGKIKDIKVYNTALSDSELETLTT